jgi:SAM-dependent methyltransferase
MPFRNYHRTVSIIRRICTGQARQLLWVLYLRLRGIDLGFASTQDLGIPTNMGAWYSNSGGPNLDNVLKELPIHPNDSVLDIGCGKGGALITMSKYPFKYVDGLDISNHLLSVAKSNLNKISVRKNRFFCSNAATFKAYDDYSYLYMYNPFPCEIMKLVITNIISSLKVKPRAMTIIYMNPVCHHVIEDQSEFMVVRKFVHSGHLVNVYKNLASSKAEGQKRP